MGVGPRGQRPAAGTIQRRDDKVRRVFRALVPEHDLAVAGAGEAWVGLWFMGHALAWSDVLILESIAFALRTAAFIVPSRLGVQEAGYVLLGALFGLSPDVALALSLLKRGREIATGVPCLIIWQGMEGRRLWWRDAARDRPGE